MIDIGKTFYPLLIPWIVPLKYSQLRTFKLIKKWMKFKRDSTNVVSLFNIYLSLHKE